MVRAGENKLRIITDFYNTLEGELLIPVEAWVNCTRYVFGWQNIISCVVP